MIPQLLFRITSGDAPVLIDPRAIVITVMAETRTFTVEAEDRTIAVPARADIIVPAEEGHE